MKDIAEFSENFDTYITRRRTKNAVALVRQAAFLDKRLTDLELSANFTASLLDASESVADDRGSLSVALPLTNSFTDFIERLSAIQSMYEEVCNLLQISQVDSPLQIVKIESGSLWASVAGDEKVLEIIAGFIRSFAGFMYRNLTTEGKIAAIPRKVESIDALIGLRDKLRAAGHETGEIDANLQKAAIQISKDLTTLLDCQPSVTVNAEVISIDQERAAHKIPLDRIPRLQNSIDERTDESTE